ncbi:MAG: VWA domain-containing protein [Bryobacteraceae bacterium]|nr:VWA domain-containing protein [Bryobacteraceae bacterium]
MITRTLTLCFILCALAPAQPELTIRTTTRLVSVDVIVRDKDGRPVRDLAAADFTVLDDGKPQQVRFLRAPGQGIGAPAPPQAAARLGLPPELPANIFTNANSADAAPQAVSVILFDGLNTPIDDQRYAKLQVLKLLRRLKPTDRIGLYVLGAQLRVVHDYSTDARSLLDALGLTNAQLLANPETESSFAQLLNNQKLDQILNQGEAERALNQVFTDQQVALTRLQGRIQKTFDALEAIAQHLAPVPGRKNLLWVSAAFPMVVGTDVRTGTGSPQTFALMAARATRAIANAGVAIYPIDARGVMVDPLYKAKSPYRDYAMAQVVALSRSRGGRRGGRATFTSPDPMVFADRDETESHHDIMVELAKRTGGRASFNSNDTAGLLRDALDEAADNYTLAWYPSPIEDNGRFRKIEVKANRPGLALRHREGYFAAEPTVDTRERQREALLEAMSGPLELGAVPFAAQLDPAPAGKLRVTLKIDPAAVSLREAKGHWLGHVDVVFLYLDAQANAKGGSEEAVPLKLTAPDRDEAFKNGFLYQAAIPSNTEAHKLVIAVRDAPTGRLGTLQIQLSKLPR